MRNFQSWKAFDSSGVFNVSAPQTTGTGKEYNSYWWAVWKIIFPFFYLQTHCFLFFSLLHINLNSNYDNSSFKLKNDYSKHPRRLFSMANKKVLMNYIKFSNILKSMLRPMLPDWHKDFCVSSYNHKTQFCCYYMPEEKYLFSPYKSNPP